MLTKRSVKGSKLTHQELDDNWTQIEAWLAQKSSLSHSHDVADVNNLQNVLDSKLPSSKLGAPNGATPLDAQGLTPLVYLAMLNLNSMSPVLLPTYQNHAAADSDNELVSGRLYKLDGDRTVYQKP